MSSQIGLILSKCRQTETKLLILIKLFENLSKLKCLLLNFDQQN